MAYNVFISYRRDGGFETARHLFDLLTHDGYTVSFDLDSLREGPFDSALLERIDACNDFILVVNKTAFVRTLDPEFDPQNDWLRAELAYALKKGKNVIPVLLAGATIPANLPEDLESLPNLNRPSYSIEYFDSFYEKLKTFLHSKPSGQIANDECGEIHIETDVECNVFCFKKWVLRAVPSEDNVLHLKPGKYRISVVSEEFPDLEEGFVIDIPTSGYNDYISINFLLQINGRFHLKPSEKDGKWGFVSEDGKVRIPFKYDDAHWFSSDGLASVKLNGKYGAVNIAGDIVIPFLYAEDLGFSEGLARARIGREYGYIGINGRVIIPFIYSEASSFSEGLAPVRENGIWKYINHQGETILSCPNYHRVYSFEGGLAEVEYANKFGFIDKLGKEIIPVIYDQAYCLYDHGPSLKEGPIFLKAEGKWGLINRTGTIVAPFIYEEVGDKFREKRSFVRKGDKWGFINTDGVEVIPFVYDNAKGFYYGRAWVEKDGESFYIDLNGNRI